MVPWRMGRGGGGGEVGVRREEMVRRNSVQTLNVCEIYQKRFDVHNNRQSTNRKISAGRFISSAKVMLLEIRIFLKYHWQISVKSL